ncbi:MAG: DUF3416 domain-containing protein [Gammaproteobacteria bacterium]
MPSVEGARIYNLFPLLAGPLETWADHVPRIAAMAFDWISINPFHAPGTSGSLYSIRSFDALHPVVAGGEEGPWDDRLAAFCRVAEQSGLRVMVDLVLDHSARDGDLVKRFPAWFDRPSDQPLARGHALDPSGHHGTPPDLAPVRYPDALRDEQLAFWGALIRRYRACGVTGFRCAGAHRVPEAFWRALIDVARADDGPAPVFCADALGAPPEEVVALGRAGFDLAFNSSRWWDFRAPWLLDQYEQLRPALGTVSFPERHDTPRLASELAGLPASVLEAHYGFRYQWAACFSAAVLMPMGYEYGFTQPLDTRDTRPGQWDAQLAEAPFDLSERITAMNRLKARLAALGHEGPQRRLNGPDAATAVMVRRHGEEAAVVVVNPSAADGALVDPAKVLESTGISRWRDVTPGSASVRLAPGRAEAVEPLGVRIWMREPGKPRKSRRTREAQLARLQSLADARVAIEKVTPEIDGGRFPVKRILGEGVDVSADIFCDGHDVLRAAVRFRRKGKKAWSEAPLSRGDNDRWSGRFHVDQLGRFEYTVVAWRDRFRTWRDETGKKNDAGLDIGLELREGTELVAEAVQQASGEDAGALEAWHRALKGASDDATRLSHLMAGDLLALMDRAAPRSNLTIYDRSLDVVVDRPAAAFAAWYEMFPRSQSPVPGRHGTFRDVIQRLPYVRDLGFDVLYFTPVHPIGRTHRKGRNNTLLAGRDDPGSVYAIGAREGGHTAVHPELGTLEDFRALVAAARDHDLEIALDIAVQCSPDHPWLTEHPEWFDWRPDGTIKYAENPPKKYEDIVNVHFYRDAIPGLWFELKRVFEFWMAQGVKTFRVDNPHTKPFPFWEWLIGELKQADPEVVLLAEAFTRPKVMLRLAKLGFTQSYTYFTWRNHKAEMAAYLEELATGEYRETFRPNFFVNTPDINPAILQSNERPAYEMRLVLAATLSGLYGIYNGFEICEGTPVPGKEEYLDSEKYEIKTWDFERPGNIRSLIRRLNRIRRENPALRTHTNIRFLNAWNEHVLCYYKATPERDNNLLILVNMDHRNVQETHFEVPLWEFGLPDDGAIEVEDLLEGHVFTLHGKIQHVRLDPDHGPARIWRLRPAAAL